MIIAILEVPQLGRLDPQMVPSFPHSGIQVLVYSPALESGMDVLMI